MPQINILVVDDEKEIAELVEIYLVSDGYKVFKAYNAEEGLKILEEQEIHLVLLDIMMPGMNGLEMCRKIRTKSNIPIIMLSAKSTDLDKIVGLTGGADDYVTKPFSLSVLRARVRTQLRNHAEQNGTAEKAIFSQGKYRFDFAHMIFTVGGEIAELSKTEQKLLKVLTDNCGRTVSRDVLINRVWDRASLFSCREGESDKTVRIFLLAERFWKD